MNLQGYQTFALSILMFYNIKNYHEFKVWIEKLRLASRGLLSDDI